MIRLLILNFFLSLNLLSMAQERNIPQMVANPILPGFNPDPSVCRVGDDYYLVTSSFAFYPGLPIYHSKDMVNWRLVGHALNENNIGGFHFDGIGDNDGIWAPTIRYNRGTFYISCTAWRSGGNFIITATDPAGPWSKPVWVPEASGIDPTLFFDDDGKCYYVGNRYDFKQSWRGQVGIHIQEISLDTIVDGTVREKKAGIAFKAPTYRLKGENKIISYGHASNASYAEGPHIYKINGIYYLLMAEGGSGAYHAVTVSQSKSLFGPYLPQQVNPVLTHRHMGNRYPIQNIGHADIIQTQHGEWYAICLGNRMLPIPGNSNQPYACPLGRETWLTPVAFQDGQLIFAPGVGRIDSLVCRPQLPWTPVAESKEQWYTPLTMPSLRLKKLNNHFWNYELAVSNSSAVEGIILFRTVNSYYSLIKTKKSVVLSKMAKGKLSVLTEVPSKSDKAILRIQADGMRLQFYCDGIQIGGEQSFLPLCDDRTYNKFNGTGVGYILREGR